MIERIRQYRAELEVRGEFAEVDDEEGQGAVVTDSRESRKHDDLLAEVLMLEGDRLSRDLKRSA